MLYKFKSKATGDLIMLEPTGRKILQALGKEPTPKGILQAQDMAEAISRLQAAIAQEDELWRQAREEASAQGLPPPREPELRLRQKAFPFIEMLQRCAQADEPVVWGV